MKNRVGEILVRATRPACMLRIAADMSPLRIGICLLFIASWVLATSSEPRAQTQGQGVAQTMSLDDLKRLALERNLGLKATAEEVLGAKAEIGSRYADFFPKLSVEARYSRAGNAPRVEIPAGGFSAVPLLPPVDTELATGALTNYGLRLSLEQPLFTGGAIYYAYENAKLGYSLAGFGHQRTAQDLLLRVELAYWDILKTERLLAVAEQQVSDLKEHLRVVKASYGAGGVPYHEVLKTAVNLAEAEQRRLAARNNVDLARMTMNNLLRQDLAEPLQVSALGDEGSIELIPYEEALKTARDRRIELQAGRTQVETMRVRENMARSGYYPTLSAVANYDRARETVSVLPENWEVLGVLRWTFWEWGKTGQEVERMEFRVRQSEDDLQALEDRIALEVREQYLRAVEAQEKIAVARDAVKQAEENYRITQERFAAGVTTNTEVLDAESLLVAARANHTNAIYDFQSARARLLRATGLQTVSEVDDR